jgi:hypothetical protein
MTPGLCRTLQGLFSQSPVAAIDWRQRASTIRAGLPDLFRFPAREKHKVLSYIHTHEQSPQSPLVAVAATESIGYEDGLRFESPPKSGQSPRPAWAAAVVYLLDEFRHLYASGELNEDALRLLHRLKEAFPGARMRAVQGHGFNCGSEGRR